MSDESDDLEKAVRKAIQDVLVNKKSTPNQKMQAAGIALKWLEKKGKSPDDKAGSFFKKES